MTNSNFQITTREYKLMLNTKRFKERENGIKAFLKIIGNQIELTNENDENGDIYFDEKKERKRKNRLVWYIDTSDHQLKENRFLLRVRKEKSENDKKEYTIDLKCRNPDRYIAASYDLVSNLREIKNEVKFEFEEDVVPRVDNIKDIKPDFASKFSQSVSFREGKEPIFKKFKDLVDIFPALNKLNIDPHAELRRVNDFVANEISINIGKIKLRNKDISTDDLSLSFWYLSKETEKNIPVIIEFSFDYYAKGKDESNELNKNGLEEFPISLVRKVNDFYFSLFTNDEFVDFKTSKTKTEFAYQYLTIIQ